MIAARIMTACVAAMVAMPVYAQLGCAKVDYVEAKDWSVEELERTYCHDYDQWHRYDKITDFRMQSDLRRYVYGCLTQAALYERILKNVHKRPIPACS
jgi:hypothetical protein